MVGQWNLIDHKACDLPEKAASAFNAVYGGSRLGCEIKPVLYCGEQLVSGHNYMYICESTMITNPPIRKLIKVVVNESLDGKYSEIDCQELIQGTI